MIVLIVAIVLIISVTFAAIFRNTIKLTRWFTVSNFSAESIVWFEGTDPSAMGPYKTEYGVRATVIPSDPNFIGKLRAKVQFNGAGVGLVRVRMIEEWSTKKTENNNTIRVVQPYRQSMPYSLAPAAYSGTGNKRAWLDNRTNDYCFYYTTPVYSTTTREIPLINGVNTDNIDLGILPSDTEVHVLFETDAVQVNRYPQYWNMNSLPWSGGLSSTELELTEVAAGS